jgi:hypothetical protein
MFTMMITRAMPTNDCPAVCISQCGRFAKTATPSAFFGCCMRGMKYGTIMEKRWGMGVGVEVRQIFFARGNFQLLRPTSMSVSVSAEVPIFGYPTQPSCPTAAHLYPSLNYMIINNNLILKGIYE